MEDKGAEDSRFYCPFAGCKRSFAELWRLKVHYRAPPDIRGSGKERGHGTELTHCPKCGKALKPGKHHVGCSAGKSAPRAKKAKGLAEATGNDTQPKASTSQAEDMGGADEGAGLSPRGAVPAAARNGFTPMPPPAAPPFGSPLSAMSADAMPMDASQFSMNGQRASSGLAAAAPPPPPPAPPLAPHGAGSSAAAAADLSSLATVFDDADHSLEEMMLLGDERIPSPPPLPPDFAFLPSGAMPYVQMGMMMGMSMASPMGGAHGLPSPSGGMPPAPPPPPQQQQQQQHLATVHHGAPGGLLFNFSQFEHHRMPMQQQQQQQQGAAWSNIPAVNELELNMGGDLWGAEGTVEAQSDGELMQLLFGAPDQLPSMATTHMHHFLSSNNNSPADGGGSVGDEQAAAAHAAPAVQQAPLLPHCGGVQPHLQHHQHAQQQQQQPQPQLAQAMHTQGSGDVGVSVKLEQMTQRMGQIKVEAPPELAERYLAMSPGLLSEPSTLHGLGEMSPEPLSPLWGGGSSHPLGLGQEHLRPMRFCGESSEDKQLADADLLSMLAPCE